MDNFRRSKRNVNTGNIDGMIRGRMRGSVQNSPKQKTKKTFSESVARPEARIGNFGRKEGFIARKTAPIKPDGRALGRQRSTTPIDMSIDEPKKTRRKTKKQRNWKTIFRRTALGAILLTLLIGGYLGAKGYLRARQVFQGGGESIVSSCDPDPSTLKKEGDGRINFLILGKGGPEQTDGPDLTDTIILASLDPCNKQAGLLSIPRDLVVKMDSGESTKINAVYALTKMSAKSNGKTNEEAEKAGLDAIEKSVENIVGIKIDRYVMLDFTAFEQAINAVGGININVKKPVVEQMKLKGKQYYLNVPKGNQQFDGLKALAYSRSRYTSSRGDFDRSERQREIIIALKEKVFTVGTFSNPVKISQLIDAFGSRVRTNISGTDEIKKLYDVGKDISGSNIKSLSMVDEPNVLIGSGSASLGLGSIQVPTEGLFKYDAIRTFVRTSFIDGFILRENPGIVVLNGTNIGGIAKTQSALLKSYGYNIIKTGDAPNKNTPNTIIVDLKKKDNKYTKRYLELRYKTTTTTELPAGITPPENADFVIIVGQNEASN